MQAKQQAGATKPLIDKNKGDRRRLSSPPTRPRPGVQTLPDGLQYKVLTEGSGASPKADRHRDREIPGTLIDGTEFDSSEKQPGGTVSFPGQRRDPRLDRGAPEDEDRLPSGSFSSRPTSPTATRAVRR